MITETDVLLHAAGEKLNVNTTWIKRIVKQWQLEKELSLM